MKNTFTFLFCLLFIVAINFNSTAQQVAREYVVYEGGTATWCGYCPSHAHALEQMLEEGKKITVVEYHGSDDYANEASNARNSYYGITGFPTALWDGILKIVGASNYNAFLPKYNQRMAKMCDFTIDVQGTNAGDEDFTVSVDVTKVADNSDTDLVVQVILTESNIPENWAGGMTELDFVERGMYPSHEGTPINFDSGDMQTVDTEFTLDPSWVFENCELTIFVQSNATKEILQATKVLLSDLQTGPRDNAAIDAVENVASTNCTGSIEPILALRNASKDPMTNVDIVYNFNNGETTTINWTGNLAPNEETKINIGEMNIMTLESNVFMAYVTDPNGTTDIDNSNDTIRWEFTNAMETSTTLKYSLRTDNNPEETTWEITNSAGEVLFSGGPYEDASTWVLEDEIFELNSEDCYTFSIYDEGGNGLNNGNGIGRYDLRDANGGTIAKASEFESEVVIQFGIDIVGMEDAIANDNNINIYPNPINNSATVAFNLNQTEKVQMNVYNLLGEVVYSLDKGVMNAGNNEISFSANELSAGVYFIQLSLGNNVITKKVSVTK